MKKIQEFILREIADEYLLIPTGKTTETFNGMVTLTESGAFIYKHLEEVSSFDELVDLIIKEYDIDKETAANDAYMFVAHMLVQGMIELSDPENNW